MTNDEQLAALLNAVGVPRTPAEIDRSAAVFASSVETAFNASAMVNTIRIATTAICARLKLEGMPEVVAAGRAQSWAHSVLEHLMADIAERLGGELLWRRSWSSSSRDLGGSWSSTSMAYYTLLRSSTS
jgi:hypothetical protein